MFKTLLLAVTLAGIGGSQLVAAVPAVANDDAMMPKDAMMTKIDCAKAPEMLSNAQRMGTTTAYTGEIDRVMLPALMDREKGTNMMLKIEAACGTDPKMKAMAAKAAADSDMRMKMMQSSMPDHQ